MKRILKVFYMFLFHPVLFFKYSIKKDSKGLLVKGTANNLHTKGLIIGKNVRFGNNIRIDFYAHGKLRIGNNCYFVNNNTFLVGDDIIIGDKVLVASDVLIASENHIPNPESDNIYGELAFKPVVIESGCWIAEKVCIMPGVKIGKYSVIGAASVVTKDIPAYSIAVGNPARVIKKYNLNNHLWESL